ncbi:putative reverse transcriptase domain-containing protein [Tanacetum coccineum]
MTPESVQAMIDQALLRNSTNGDGSHSSHEDNRRNVQTARPCFYADFMKCQPLNFKGNEGVVGLTRWIEKMESVFNISGCAIENQVKFATCTLLGAALTWWNGQIRTLGPDAYSMTWEVLKKKMTDKYCPQGEIKKLEIELWNLKVKGNDVPTYTERFQELTLICTKFVANETEKVDKYISGLPDNIYGNDKSARPKTLDETIELANDLMDQKLCTYAERQTDNKRKADDASRNNHGHQQQPFKRQNVAKVYNMGSGKKKPYGGSLPKYTKCHFHHNVPCTQKCHKCNKIGHFARDCRSFGNTNVANAQRDNKAIPKGNVGNAEKKGNALRDPDSNVVTGTFLLNNRYASILFDTGADRSFISTAFSSLIDIASTPLENSYDVELADEKIVGFRRYYRHGLVKKVSHRDRAQEYMVKGCQIFLAQVSAKKEEDKSEGKQLKDVPIVQDFSEVFLEDLSGLPPARPVNLQIDLIPGAAPVARSPYRLVPSEMKELKRTEHEEHRKAILDCFKKEMVVSPNPAKIKSIKDWASPKTPTKIRQFLSLAGYYRRFIEGFSKIAKSMTKLTKKGIKFDWGEKEENAFQLIKQKLCSAPILALPEGSEDFVVYCDASHKVDNSRVIFKRVFSMVVNAARNFNAASQHVWAKENTFRDTFLLVMMSLKRKQKKGSKETAKSSRKKMLGRKRAGKEQQHESSKKQKVEKEKESDKVEEVDEC